MSDEKYGHCAGIHPREKKKKKRKKNTFGKESEEHECTRNPDVLEGLVDLHSPQGRKGKVPPGEEEA